MTVFSVCVIMPSRLKGSDYLTHNYVYAIDSPLATMRAAKVNDQSEATSKRHNERLLQLTRCPVNRFNYNGVCYPSDRDTRLRRSTVNVFSQFIWRGFFFILLVRSSIKTCSFLRFKLKRTEEDSSFKFKRTDIIFFAA